MKTLLLIPLAILRLLIQSAMLALGQIWANKTRSLLTTLGIIIGVSSVSAVIAAMSNMNDLIKENFETFGTKKIFLFPDRPTSGAKKNADWWQIRFKQEEFDGMLEYCPSVECKSFVSDGLNLPARFEETSVESVHITGVEADWFVIENLPVIMGRPFSHLDETQGRKVCLITKKLRDKLQMDRECTGQTITFGYHTFLVIGLLDEKPDVIFENSRDNLEAYIPFRTMRKISYNDWFRVMANCKSTDLAEEAKAEIRFFLRRTRQIRPGDPDTFRVILMENEAKRVMGVLGMISAVAFGIVSISLLVGGIGIMNIMLVSVSERTREIGLRKAVGAKPSAILTQFLVEAVVLCMFGGLIGVAFGQLLTWIIAKFLPLMEGTAIPFWAILLSFGFSAAVGVIFGMFPAVKAARLNPIDALRHE
jgi:putative ABC transport system permease protein